MLRYAPLALVPAAAACGLLDLGPIWTFAAGGAAIAVLADWVRRGTEQLACHLGPAIGSLLNVSFGSVAELILALFVLAAGHVEVVQAQITGSIIGTALFGLGLAALVGGWSRQTQELGNPSARLLSTLLTLLVIALLLPAVFDLAQRPAGEDSLRVTEQELSLGVAGVLLLLYAGNLVFTLVTHRSVFAGREPGEEPSWSLWTALGLMLGGTVAIAGLAEMVSGALEETGRQLGLSTVFLGVVPLALTGTAADIFAAVVFARQDRICVGSAIQMALVVAPLLALLSFLIGAPMSLVFGSPLDLFAVAGTAFVVRSVAADASTNWFEGLLLVGIYAMLALAFFFLHG
jgi:Ca2+:H+ antiporter